jgi:hypothetical protein
MHTITHWNVISVTHRAILEKLMQYRHRRVSLKECHFVMRMRGLFHFLQKRASEWCESPSAAAWRRTWPEFEDLWWFFFLSSETLLHLAAGADLGFRTPKSAFAFRNSFSLDGRLRSSSPCATFTRIWFQCLSVQSSRSFWLCSSNCSFVAESIIACRWWLYEICVWQWSSASLNLFNSLAPSSAVYTPVTL